MPFADCYSYHTFILPFVWEGTGERRRSMEEFVGCFRDNPHWVCTDMPDEYYIRQSPSLTDRDDALLLYKEYQYFHPFVRKAVYGFGENIVTNYSFMPEKMRNNGHYYITKGKRTFDLTLNAVNLKIFNTGIALFIMECENRRFDTDGNRQDDFGSVKNINDYGMRISLPFIAEGYSICADKLCVELPGEFRFEEDFSGYISKAVRSDDLYDSISLTHMCDFIKDILGYGSMSRFTSKRYMEKHAFYIYPALDDRMFVCCIVNDSGVTQKMLAIRDGKYAYKKDKALAESLYEFMFIDPPTQCSCKDKGMRNELIDNHLYKRWLGEKSIYTIAAQGLMLLSDNPPYYLVESFLTEYIQMCCLSLVQRATLIHFQREASNMSANIEKSGKAINRVTIMKLMNLQERFVAYKSQIAFTEVSPQEQAIEMYDMMQDVMFIERETESLASHLESLNDAADTNLDFGFNRIALVFTWVSAFLAVMQDAMYLFEGNGSGKAAPIIFGLVMTASLVAITVIIFRYRRRD